jgi:transposase, IS5 family
LVSLFEPYADIIVESRCDVQHRPKLNIATGKSGMILDVGVEDSNAADAARFMPMLERHVAFCKQAPRQSAADGD